MVAYDLMNSLYKYYHSSNMNLGDRVGLFMSFVCTLIVEMCVSSMARFVVKNEHQKVRFRDEIGVCAQNILNNLCSIVNMIGRAYILTYERQRESSLWPPLYVLHLHCGLGTWNGIWRNSQSLNIGWDNSQTNMKLHQGESCFGLDYQWLVGYQAHTCFVNLYITSVFACNLEAISLTGSYDMFWSAHAH